MTPEKPPTDACVFLDVDGTLIDIAPRPDAVVVRPGLIDILARAEHALDGALALVSGRSITDLDGLFAPLVLRASGVHGAEFRFGRHEAIQAKAFPLPPRTWDDLMAALNGFPGMLAENKGYSYAVHYRSAPALGPSLLSTLGHFVADRPDLGLAILPGHFVYELKRPQVDKGGAIAEFMSRAPFAGRRPIFIGDDVTDAPGFLQVRALGGSAYSVRQTFPGVNGVFADPNAVRQWLAGIDQPEALTA